LLGFHLAGLGKSKRRQRLEDLPESKTVTKIISLIGTGGSHVNGAHDLVQTVRDDGFDNPALATFASCGAYGRHDANTERDLLRWLRGLWGVHLEPYEIKLQLQAWLVSQFFAVLQFEAVFHKSETKRVF
jgi:hypothetical protein